MAQEESSVPQHPIPDRPGTAPHLAQTGMEYEMQPAIELLNLRVWRDERLGARWRVAYNEGDGETIVAFPDAAALGDFIEERLGLSLLDDRCDVTAWPDTICSDTVWPDPSSLDGLLGTALLVTSS